MIYSSDMEDGSTAITQVIPSFVVAGNIRAAVAGVAMQDGKVMLLTSHGKVPTTADDIGHLRKDSVLGAELEFPAMEDIAAKWTEAASGHREIDRAEATSIRDSRNTDARK